MCRTAGILVALEPLQICAHVGSVLIAKVAVLLQSLVNGLFQARGQIGIEADSLSRNLVQNGIEDGRRALAAKRKNASGHFIEHDSERKEVGPRVEIFRQSLLGRHVGDRAKSAAWTRQMLRVHFMCSQRTGIAAGRCSVYFGQAEIENLGMAALGDEEVRRLN